MFERHHALAAEGVRAYVNDEDADVSNITEKAVEEDALVAAWNLTGRWPSAVAEPTPCCLSRRTGHRLHA